MTNKQETNNTEEILEIGKQLQEEMDASILITRSEKGIMLLEKNNASHSIQTKAKEVYDVSGAGDTVTAILALALCTGTSLKLATELANIAAGVVVSKLGTATIDAQELVNAIQKEE